MLSLGAQRFATTAVGARLRRPAWAPVDTHQLPLELSASEMTAVSARCEHAELSVSQE